MLIDMPLLQQPKFLQQRNIMDIYNKVSCELRNEVWYFQQRLDYYSEDLIGP